MRSVVFFVLLAVLLEFVDCKKMWGSRKKREDAEQVVVPPTKKSNIFEANKGKSGRSARRYNSPIDDSEALDSGKFQEMFNLYLNSFEELLESEDFDAIVNPGSIRSMMLQFSGGADIPELSHLLNMPELNNPDILKATMREGLSIAKTSGAEIFALINDPDKMEELVGQLPSEVKDLIAGLSTGDFSKLKDFVNLPGLDDMQRRLLLSLLDGNTAALEAEMQRVLGDETQVEAARLQLLEAPELAQAMGIPADLLQDPVRWAQTMAEGADALFSGAEGGTRTRSSFPAAARSGSGSAGLVKGQAAVMRQLLKSFAQDRSEADGEQELGLEGEGAEEDAVPFAKRRFAAKVRAA